MSTNSMPLQHPELTPRVFIGSSSEALNLAHRIGDELKRGQELEVKVWNQSVLQSGEMLLEGLLRLVNLFDFVLLLLSADDIIESRDEREGAPRDNVVFELGMFMGVLGRRRALPIIVEDPSNPIKLPTNLDGLLRTRLDISKIHNAAYLSKEVAKVREQIKRRSSSAPLSLLPSTGLAYGYFNNFLIPVKERFSALTRSTKDYNEEELGEIKSIKFIGEISQGKFTLLILYPRLASLASIDNRDECIKKLGLESVSVKYKGRSYPFFVYPEHSEDGQVQFADYPTTLRSSSDAIDLVLSERELGEFREEREQLQRREVTNFIKALKHLLERNQASVGSFGDRVKFQQL